jgi:hypothetical protein
MSLQRARSRLEIDHSPGIGMTRLWPDGLRRENLLNPPQSLAKHSSRNRTCRLGSESRFSSMAQRDQHLHASLCSGSRARLRANLIQFRDDLRRQRELIGSQILSQMRNR